MHLTIHTIDDAPAESRPVLEGIAADAGGVPNLAATAAAAPALLAGFDGLRRAVASTKLDPVLREVAGVTVGVLVDNRYGVAWHSTQLAGLGVDDADIDQLRTGGAPAGAAAAAAQAVARDVVLQRGRISDATLDAAMDAGLTTEAVLEIVLECAFASMVGLIDNAADHVELDAFLAPRAWSG